MNAMNVAPETEGWGSSGATVERASLQSSLQQLHSTHASAPADAASCLEQLYEEVTRDVRAAQVRATALEEEVDSFLTRVANTHDAVTTDIEDGKDAVVEKVKAIRRARGD
ncbi:hypothetical protein JKF63_00342 [Porcisia hertigi]|uniref:Uncharacterized protein n=1 Tax=Porcisia hertigi TaxID=2761500 RepID=A0A836L6S4_9TRYP|nr:hypothetical protein JKF63_00342 [Porcisia hertigi]